MCRKILLYSAFVVVIFINHQKILFAQEDTLGTSKLDSFLKNQKGVVHQLTKSLLTDTTEEQKYLQSNDQAFQQFRGRIIRRVTIKSLDFGVPITDTSNALNNKLTRLANNLHWNTRKKVISKNLFFRPNDRLSPYLLGDNERYLRALPYLQDVRIKVLPVSGSEDSVDVLVVSKDVISIGGGLHMHNTQSASVTLREDNLRGVGNRFLVQMMYDGSRQEQMGYGFEYINRNIGGSFIDGSIGYLNYDKTIGSRKPEERTAYVKFIKPLVHPYLRWTYALNASVHTSQNMYENDSVYLAYLQYKANYIDAWVTLNTSAGHIVGENKDNRLRTSLSLRFLHQHFNEKPSQYSHQYNYLYADQTGLLAAFSLFKQNFFKVRYLYGFGRPEDVPQGADASLTLGWVAKDQRKRPYIGIDFQRFYFNAAEQYFDFTLQADGYLHKSRLEDVNLLGRMGFINHIHEINGRWKQRLFLNAEIVKQFNGVLNEPVFPYRLYGTPEVDHQNVGGDLRAHLSAESVFYSPWSLLYFKLAPFAFGDASLFRTHADHSSVTDLYTAMLKKQAFTGSFDEFEKAVVKIHNIIDYKFQKKCSNLPGW